MKQILGTGAQTMSALEFDRDGEIAQQGDIAHHHRPSLARWQRQVADYRRRCIQQVPHRTHQCLVPV